MCLVPQNVVTVPTQEQLSAMQTLCMIYASDLAFSCDIALAELSVWYRQLSRLDYLPGTAMEAFMLCNATTLPCIKMLQIMLKLPVTTCASERSFSTLRRLKTYLRITIGSDRLNGLALLNIHRSILVSPGEIVNKLCEKPSRLPFRLI